MYPPDREPRLRSPAPPAIRDRARRRRRAGRFPLRCGRAAAIGSRRPTLLERDARVHRTSPPLRGEGHRESGAGTLRARFFRVRARSKRRSACHTAPQRGTALVGPLVHSSGPRRLADRYAPGPMSRRRAATARDRPDHRNGARWWYHCTRAMGGSFFADARRVAPAGVTARSGIGGCAPGRIRPGIFGREASGYRRGDGPQVLQRHRAAYRGSLALRGAREQCRRARADERVLHDIRLGEGGRIVPFHAAPHEIVTILVALAPPG